MADQNGAHLAIGATAVLAGASALGASGQAPLGSAALPLADLMRRAEEARARTPAGASAAARGEATGKASTRPQAKSKPQSQVKPQAKTQAKAQAKTRPKPPAKAQAKAQAKTPAKAQAKTQAKSQARGQASLRLLPGPAVTLAASASPQPGRQQAPTRGRGLDGVTVVVTGFRDAALGEAIRAAGGFVGEGVTRATGLVVARDPSSQSGKAQRARAMGLEVISVAELERRLRGGPVTRQRATKPAEQRSATPQRPIAPTADAQRPALARRPTTDPLRGGVLLAEKWGGTDPSGLWASEKLDGVRAYWDGEALYSRNGNPFYAPTWFTRLLPASTELDGELYVGPGRFNETVSIVRARGGGEGWRRIRYMVFDAPESRGPFRERMEAVRRAVERACALYNGPGMCPIVEVRQTPIRSAEELTRFHRKATRQGVEGTMLRDPESAYERSRSRTLLKVKDFGDAEAEVVGHVPGAGKHQGRLGAYEAEDLKTGARFRVGTGLSDADRERPLPIGAIISYRYQELTPAGVPRFPSFVGVRDYE